MRVILISLAAILALAVHAGAQVQRPKPVRVEMIEFAFRPATIRLAAGRAASLLLVNRGQIAHQLETDYLKGLGVRVVGDALLMDAPGLEVVRLDPGGSARLEFFPLRKGRFAFACTIEGHKEAGMIGVLEVR